MYIFLVVGKYVPRQQPVTPNKWIISICDVFVFLRVTRLTAGQLDDDARSLRNECHASLNKAVDVEGGNHRSMKVY